MESSLPEYEVNDEGWFAARGQSHDFPKRKFLARHPNKCSHPYFLFLHSKFDSIQSYDIDSLHRDFGQS